MKYDVEFSCGHIGTVTLFGKHKDREWRLEKYRENGLCEECQKKLHDKLNAEALEEANEMGLPELSGSEKQVAWAITIRQNFINQIENENYVSDDAKQQVLDIMQQMLEVKTSASWWIDNRDTGSRYLLGEFYNEHKKANETKVVDNSTVAEDAKEEMTISSENVCHDGKVEVVVEDGKVKAIYEKNDEFRSIVKKLDFKWNGRRWCRTINQFTGTAVDRAGELIAELVKNGFRVYCTNNDARDKAINATYEPKNNYWIVKSGENLGIKMFVRNDDAYNQSRKITNSRWDSNENCVVVASSHYKEVLDFAEKFGFAITSNARKLIDEQISKDNNTLTVAINQMQSTKYHQSLDTDSNSDYNSINDLSDLSDEDNTSVAENNDVAENINIVTELLDYQANGVEKLSKLKVGALFMEQGTGKTRTTLELISLRLKEKKVSKVLWLCPCSVKENLKNDITKHCGQFPSLIKIVGIETLSSSDSANVECLQYVADKRCYLIVDESLLVKNPNALRSKNIIRLSQLCTYKLILNGTPISRTEADLFTQFYVLDWRILGYKSYWSFSANHLEIDENGRIVRCLNTDYLTKKIEPFAYEIKKSDVLKLPSKEYYVKYFLLDEEQREEYDRVMDMFLEDVNDFEPETIYRLFTALQLVLSGRRIVSKLKESIRSVPMVEPNENPRMVTAMNLVDKYVASSTKCIIFCKYSHEIDELCECINVKYGNHTAVKFYGKMNIKRRNQSIEDFKNGSLFMIANKACAGFGLNLQFCSNIIFYSNDWDYATRVQAEDRCHRIGQNNNVVITDIVATNKLDDRILSCLYKKESILDIFKSKLSLTSGNIANWLGGKRKLNDKMIRIGLDTNMKSRLVNEYLTQKPNIDKVYVFYFKNTKHILQIDKDVPVEYIEFADTEMYVFYYRLLEEVDGNKLIIIDELMRSTAKNRSQLKYNCIHKYLNQTPHRIVFEYYPIIDSLDDFMILLDFYDEKFKMQKFDESFLKSEDIKCVPRKLNIVTTEVPIDENNENEYNDYKEKLFDELGNKDPSTVPRELQLFVGKFKKKIIFDDKDYIARNKRFKKSNVTAYGDIKEPQQEHKDYVFIDVLMNRLHLNDFLKNTTTTTLNYMTTGLSIDRVVLDNLKRIEEEKEKIYAKTSLYS